MARVGCIGLGTMGGPMAGHVLDAVVLGDHGVIEGIRDGAVLLDCSTVSPSAEKELAEALAGKSVEVVDAPLSGGAEGAKNGVCTAFVGGSEAAYASAKPIQRIVRIRTPARATRIPRCGCRPAAD